MHWPLALSALRQTAMSGERTGPGGQLRVRVQRTPHHDGRPDRETAEIYAIGARIEGHKMDAREVQCDLRATIKCNK